jgi:hypothetical protein
MVFLNSALKKAIKYEFLLRYTVDFKHLYTDFLLGGKGQTLAQPEAKLAFAFGYGQITNYGNDNLSNNIIDMRYFFASQINRNEVGDFITDSNGVRYDIALTNHREDGLYNRFFKEYDDFIRHSNNEVKQDFYLTDKQKFELKTWQKFFVDNQPFILKQLKYKLNKQGVLSSATFLTLAKYQPYNLDFSQVYEQNSAYISLNSLNPNIIEKYCLVPVYQRTYYYWKKSASFSPSLPSNWSSATFQKCFPTDYYTRGGMPVPITKEPKLLHRNFQQEQSV